KKARNTRLGLLLSQGLSTRGHVSLPPHIESGDWFRLTPSFMAFSYSLAARHSRTAFKGGSGPEMATSSGSRSNAGRPGHGDPPSRPAEAWHHRLPVDRTACTTPDVR